MGDCRPGVCVYLVTAGRTATSGLRGRRSLFPVLGTPIQGMPATDIVRGCQAAMADFDFPAAVAGAGNGSGSPP